MPAMKPRPSQARMDANRRNAQLSTGPRTAEGKSRSRGNAVRHGLTGKGIALPSEDVAVVAERFASLQAELAPRSVMGVYLVHQVALAMTRTDRAAVQESAALATRVRHAAEEFDQARWRAADAALARLDTEPVAARRELMAMPEGVDLLIHTMLELRDHLHPVRPAWSPAQAARLEAICGRLPGQTHGWDGRAYSRAVLGDPSLLTERDHAEARRLPDLPLPVWAAGMLATIIDEAVKRCQTHRATLDHDAIAQDRAEAADRALFDPGPDATRARRYEASATRDLFRALALLPIVEAECHQSREELTPIADAPTADPLPLPEPVATLVARPERTPSHPAPVATAPVTRPVGINTAKDIAVKSRPSNNLMGPLASFGPPPLTDLSRVSAGRKVG